jgi:hypothetical protein
VLRVIAKVAGDSNRNEVNERCGRANACALCFVESSLTGVNVFA